MAKKRTLRGKKKAASSTKATKAHRFSKSTQGAGVTRRNKKATEKEENENEIDNDKNVVILLEPLPNDVLLGRGPTIAHHNRFTHFFTLVNRYRSAYHVARVRRPKAEIVNYILKTCGDGVPGRFLVQRHVPPKQFNAKKKLPKQLEAGWYEVTDEEIKYKKISQALREKRPAKNPGPTKRGKASQPKKKKQKTKNQQKEAYEYDLEELVGEGMEQPLLGLERSISDQSTPFDTLLLGAASYLPLSSSPVRKEATPRSRSTRSQYSFQKQKYLKDPSQDEDCTGPPGSTIEDSHKLDLSSQSFLQQNSIRQGRDHAMTNFMDHEIDRMAQFRAIPALLSLGGGGGVPQQQTGTPSSRTGAPREVTTTCDSPAEPPPAVLLTLLESAESNDLSVFSVRAVKEQMIHGAADEIGVEEEPLSAAEVYGTNADESQKRWPTTGSTTAPPPETFTVARMPSNSRESDESSVFTFTSPRPSVSPRMRRRTNVLGKSVAADHVQRGMQDYYYCNEEDDDGGGKMSAADLSYFQILNDSHRHDDDHCRMDHSDQSHAFRFSSKAFAPTTTTATARKKNGATIVTPEDKEVTNIMVSSQSQAPQKESTRKERTDTPILIQTPCLMSVTDNSTAGGAARIAMPPPLVAAPRTATTATPPLATFGLHNICQTSPGLLNRIFQEQFLLTENLCKAERQMEQDQAQRPENHTDLLNLEHECNLLNDRQITTDLVLKDWEDKVDKWI